MAYLIKKSTVALVPIGEKTKVLELNHTKMINNSPVKIVDDNCRCNGSTLDGRQKGSSYLIGTSYKPPVIVNEPEGIILIPTHSSRNSNCIWLNLSTILKYNAIAKNKVIVEFQNLKTITVDTSYSNFDRQILRATRLESILNGRNNQKHL